MLYFLFDRYVPTIEVQLAQMRADVTAMQAKVEKLLAENESGLAMELESTMTTQRAVQEMVLAKYGAEMELKSRICQAELKLGQYLRHLVLLERVVDAECELKYQRGLKDLLDATYSDVVVVKRAERWALGEGRWRGMVRSGARRHRRSSPNKDSRGGR